MMDGMVDCVTVGSMAEGLIQGGVTVSSIVRGVTEGWC